MNETETRDALDERQKVELIKSVLSEWMFGAKTVEQAIREIRDIAEDGQ